MTMMPNQRGYTGELPPARFNMARYCLAAAARSTPDKVALIVVSDADAPVESAEHWTYAQLDDAVRRVAAGLRRFGLEPGARLMIRMGNTSDYALLFFGAIAAGCVPLPSSAQLTEEEADFLLADSGAQVLAMSDELAIQPPPGRITPIPPPTIQPFLFTPPAPPASPRACCTPSVRPGGGDRCTRVGMASVRTT